METANILGVFSDLRKRYRSVDSIVDELRKHPGFERLNRATIYRWSRKPSSRTALAVEILAPRVVQKSIQVAEPETIWVIPSTMLGWCHQKSRPYGLLEQRFGIKVVTRSVATGGDAFNLLAKGEVEIALGGRDLLSSSVQDCQRLCALTKAHVAGICRENVRSVFDLEGLKFGYPLRSSIPARLSEMTRTRGIRIGRLVSMETPEQCAKALKNGRPNLDGIIAWDSFIHKVRTNLPSPLKVHSIPHGFLGSIEMSIAINLSVSHPALIRAYLSCVREAAAFVNERRDRRSFQREISNRTHVDLGEVELTLRHSKFGLADLDPDVFLSLWEREANQLKSSSHTE